MQPEEALRPEALAVRSERPGGLWLALEWFILPLVPAIVGSLYYQVFNEPFAIKGGPDPYDWGWIAWLMVTGPLLGYGFLAGATLGLSDETGQGRIRSCLSRRSVWVTVGPWFGFLAVAALFYMWSQLASVFSLSGPDFSGWDATWIGWLIGRILVVCVLGWIAYGWTLVATLALRRARREGQFRRAFRRGLAVALGFVGSLLGSFWAVTTLLREYFFDKRIMPLIVAGSALILMPGCAGTITYGEARRRELFLAMLMAWLLGLALTWRWWSRPRAKS
jgi:hypothetical protein